MGKSKNNGTNFLVQGSILAVASIISRIIGLVYRIPLNNILGDVGISYYACAFDVYNVILIISSYSLPQAVSKTVSAKAAKRTVPVGISGIKRCTSFCPGIGNCGIACCIFRSRIFYRNTLKNTIQCVCT